MDSILDTTKRTDRRHRVFKDNLPVLMFVVWLVGQVYVSSGWFHSRESNERISKAEIDAIRAEVASVSRTYVRQDVFNEVLLRINDRLASIDNKMSQTR